VSDPRTAWDEAAAVVAESLGILREAIMTEDQVTEFRRRFAAAMRDWQPHVLPDSDSELAEINEILREHGFEYPLGARGVADLAHGYRVRQEELHRIDPDHWAAP